MFIFVDVSDNIHMLGPQFSEKNYQIPRLSLVNSAVRRGKIIQIPQRNRRLGFVSKQLSAVRLVNIPEPVRGEKSDKSDRLPHRLLFLERHA